jgi:hypothetical protein
MRIRGCGLGHSARELRRHHYCGTCKVIGSDYGHASRLLLNHDTVLLAEIITALGAEPEWSASIRSRNCFSIPKATESTPDSLKYAAAATVLLAGAKVRDHVSDSGGLHWKAMARWLNPQYRRAARQLTAWGVPVDEIERQLASQKEREAKPESLEQLAEPTNFATATICRHAARVAQRTDSEPALEAFGRKFGYFTYLLDAWEDFGKDARRGEFNAIDSLYDTRESARPELFGAAEAVANSFTLLPVTQEFSRQLVTRFRANLASLFSVSLPIWAAAGVPNAFSAMPETPATATKSKPSSGKDTGGCGSSFGDCCAEGCCEGCCESICG